MTDLEKRFQEETLQTYRSAKEECGYNATYFLHMISNHGALQTARMLLSKKPSDGFTRLWELQRLDLTIEARMLQPDYVTLFTQDELQQARKRLNEYGYKAEAE